MEREKTVSLCMIVKNEEKYLEKCLTSVKELVDEMIIVDTGSTDNTITIAQKFGAKVKYYEWDNNFSNARNFSLQFASGEWILLMDGDDEFNQEDKDKFIKLVNDSTKDGHYFKTLSYAGSKPGRDIVYNLNLRLLRNNNKYKFIGAIHEQITCVDSNIDYRNFSSEDIQIFHYGYLSSVAQEKDKRKRNISIIEEELKKNPNSRFHLFNLGSEYLAAGDQKKAMQLFDKVYENLDFNSGFASKLVIKRIMCMDELGQYERALNAIEEGLKKYPTFTDLELLRGWINLKSKRYTLAIDSFKRCLEIGKPPIQFEFLNGSGTYRPYEGLGVVYFELEDYHRALEYFENVLKLNPYLHDPVYKIGAILNKLHNNKRYVSYKLSEYFNLEHVPNLILIADVLINEELYDLAMGYLQKACDLDRYNSQISILMAKILYYQRKYEQAVNMFYKLQQDNSMIEESYKYLFVCSLIQNSKDAVNILKNIQQKTDSLTYKVYSQFYNVYMGRNEIIFVEQDDHEKILHTAMDILKEVLRVREFQLFEKLLGILNCMDSNKVLLELGKLYYDNGFKQMAVKEILRSIRELNVIDPAGVRILFKEIG
ncbi:MAG: hypothetical protein PWP27_512 [Clostridiales bacterium]|jgi:glycosyltransferase involved in cell wall biosynthesis|nr:hypothetical protein [Clostridiales bacterium]MDK2932702.1 hypothetical protein [Clostridiales bacterium]